jgi:ATP-dependent helicase HrpB
LAARFAARRVAAELGERVGGRVGYQVRFEEVSSDRTKLWFLTEGVLTRKLLSDRFLHQVRVVILDEFHERHIETDLAFALLRKLQQIRKDLRLVLMSATLPENAGDAPRIEVPGRLFPVTISYTPHSALPLEQQVATAVNQMLAQAKQHILVFLPGAAEIRKAIQACEPIARQANARVLPLHGDLSAEEQDLAVAPSAFRKVICSTNVAESSITIDGVEAVIDSGLARVLSHSPWSGLSRLQIERISKSSAIQRAGRAGRTGPGIAIRLYSEADFARRPDHLPPEITRSDLTQLLLQLAAFGAAPEELQWIDRPPVDIRARAEDLLIRLGALDHERKLTGAGRRLATLPVHPRLGKFILKASEMGAKRAACDLAARLAEGRLRFDENTRSAFSSDLEMILSSDPGFQVRRLSKQLQDLAPSTRAAYPEPHALEKAMLAAYPDRVARKRGDSLLLSNGLSAKLAGSSYVHSDFLVAIEVDDRFGQATPLVRVAAEIEPDWLLDFFPDRIGTYEETVWNRDAERVEQVNSLRYDQLIIDESRSAPSDREAAASLLTTKAIEAGIERFTDAKELDRFLRRVRFAAAQDEKIRIPTDLIAATVRELAAGLTSFAQLREAAANGGFLMMLEAKLPVRLIDEIAPTHIQLPSGRRARIEYHEDRPPSVASRLQDFFGMKETPAVARGTVPLVVQLLAPNQRPVQVTTDLVSFWKNLYPQVRRELSRRYPKHAWPEVPA